MCAADRAKRAWGEPLPPPSRRLNAAERRIWREIVAAAPPLRWWDQIWVGTSARLIADWRGGKRDLAFLRECYRWLGQGRIPMRDRRALLFPDRPRKR